MKIQELAIVFIIIILPISLILSEYTQFQIKTLNTQTLYDAKLTSATYDAIKAYQLNAQNEAYSDLSNQKSSDLEASVGAFKNSIKSAFELTGYTEEDLNSYIPALVYTLYDGFQIYSPYINTNYQYEIDEEGNIIKDSTTGEPIKTEGNGDSQYGFKPYISYSCRYIRGTIDVVITYSLDNYITVQGKINNEYVNKSGYLIDGITISGEDVYYKGIKIEKEALFENVPWSSGVVPYYKENGVKYYLKDANTIVCISNGVEEVQYTKQDDPVRFNNKLALMKENDSAQRYYKSAYEFTKWFKEETKLDSLTYDDAWDEIIDENTGKITLGKIWAGNTTLIFKDSNHNIENDSSTFNQHRLKVIRHKIETNLAIAISNYNTYAGAASNVFQMPELKEDEWEHITSNIALISFLQGLPIGGKIYNGYTLVTNSESEEVVQEENIYILGSDKTYHRIGDNCFENGSVSINSSIYSDSSDLVKSAGRLNLDFNTKTYIQDENTLYYYPLKAYDASYNSVIMQNDVTTYDDIYEYVDSQSDDFKKAFYIALARERYGMYKPSNEIAKYSVLLIGTTNGSNNCTNEIISMADKLNEEGYINVKYMYTENSTEIANWLVEEKNNYHLIIVNSFVWALKNQSLLEEISKEVNLITLANDEQIIDMIKSSQHMGAGKVLPKETELGISELGNIQLSNRSDSAQYVIKFKDDVKVLYKGIYSGSLTGEYDLIGCRKIGRYKWIHGQISLSAGSINDIKLLKSLISYILE